MESGGNISNLDICLLILVKSGLPGFLVEPAVGKFLAGQESYAETLITSINK
jgi:hypothetical protein